MAWRHSLNSSCSTPPKTTNYIFPTCSLTTNKFLPATTTRCWPLAYNQNNLIFTFTSNNYVNTLKKASYEYMSEGFDKKWIPSKDNNIFYTNLNPGKYTLIVREIQYDPNQEQPRTIKMDIHIHSPRYASNSREIFRRRSTRISVRFTTRFSIFWAEIPR